MCVDGGRRGLVFGSTRHLNLKICCYSYGRSASQLDVWPVLPLLILGSVSEASVDNVIAGLEHSDRICQINLHCSSHSKKELLTAMQLQVPFPELASLYMSSKYVDVRRYSWFILGWICTTSSILPLGWHLINIISGTTQTTFVYYTPRHSLPR